MIIKLLDGDIQRPNVESIVEKLQWANSLKSWDIDNNFKCR